jgi:hypothetical protein
MEEETHWVERKGIKKPTGAPTPGVPPKVQMRKVIKTGKRCAWNINSKRLSLSTAPAVSSGAKTGKNKLLGLACKGQLVTEGRHLQDKLSTKEETAVATSAVPWVCKRGRVPLAMALGLLHLH